MVPSGIKVKNRIATYSMQNVAFIHIGEANRVYHVDKYSCSFSKMIQYWRQIWNERTNGITDLQFPFGFVQVSLIPNHAKKNLIFVVSNICKQQRIYWRYAMVTMASNIRCWLCSK
jgi:hypothetical protein